MSTASSDTPFNPLLPCTSVDAGTKESRRDATLRFVAQNDRVYLIKSYLPPRTRDEEAARAAVAREQRSAAAFEALGVSTLQPVYGPVDAVELTIDGTLERLNHVLAFPYRNEGTLEACLTPFGPKALDTLCEAGRRIAQRHKAATDIACIHSDGAPHNIFEDWVWFDFATAHQTKDLAGAKAHEVWRFLCGTLALYPGLASDDQLVAAFCEGYADRDILTLLRKNRGDKPLWLQALLHPTHFVRLCTGQGDNLTRPRTWRALNRWLNAV